MNTILRTLRRDLPQQYAWLADEPAPRMLLHALALVGTIEAPGTDDSPVIMGWAEELDIRKIYTADSIPWCGTFMSVVAFRAGYQPGPGLTWVKMLWALNWEHFGNPQTVPMLGDVLTFKRAGGGHVAMYVGEDRTHYHCLGGNQSDAVNIRRFPKVIVHSVSRAPFKIRQPANVRRVILSDTGDVATRVT